MTTPEEREGWWTKPFWACVQFLHWLGAKTNTTYEQINVILFCVLMPAIALTSVGLNVAYWMKYGWPW